MFVGELLQETSNPWDPHDGSGWSVGMRKGNRIEGSFWLQAASMHDSVDALITRMKKMKKKKAVKERVVMVVDVFGR